MQLALPVMMMVSAPITASAQGIDARVGAGPAYAGSVGFAGMVAVEVNATRWFARADVRGLLTGEDAQMVFGGGGIGIHFGNRAVARHYVMATLARGLDVREADYTTAAGIVFGGETIRALGLFGELRVEHQWQDDSPYYHLPRNQLMLIGGLRVGGR